MKTHVDYISAESYRLLIDAVNQHNKTYPDAPILKEDIVDIKETRGGHILIYYK